MKAIDFFFDALFDVVSVLIKVMGFILEALLDIPTESSSGKGEKESGVDAFTQAIEIKNVNSIYLDDDS